MRYLLDTNICIYIIKNKPKKIFDKFSEITPVDVGISSVTVSELQFGVHQSLYADRNREALFKFLLPLEIVDYDSNAAETCGKIRTDLEKEGKVIGAMDLLIAAQALSRDLILVTNNQKEFSRVVGLSLEKWV